MVGLPGLLGFMEIDGPEGKLGRNGFLSSSLSESFEEASFNTTVPPSPSAGILTVTFPSDATL